MFRVAVRRDAVRQKNVAAVCGSRMRQQRGDLRGDVSSADRNDRGCGCGRLSFRRRTVAYERNPRLGRAPQELGNFTITHSVKMIPDRICAISAVPPATAAHTKLSFTPSQRVRCARTCVVHPAGGVRRSAPDRRPVSVHLHRTRTLDRTKNSPFPQISYSTVRTSSQKSSLSILYCSLYTVHYSVVKVRSDLIAG